MVRTPSLGMLLGIALVIWIASASGGREAVTTRAAAAVDPKLMDEPGTINGAFAARSYAPGVSALLRVSGRSTPFSVQLFRVGLQPVRSKRPDLLAGTPVTVRRRITPGRHRIQRIAMPIGSWPSGMYYARLTSSKGELGFAPFVLRARRPGVSRVLVVLPTNTWQAYNFRDMDADGVGDTWYANEGIHVVDLARPYLNRGVPSQFRKYDRGFVRWLASTGRHADFVADDDLEKVPTGDFLARKYDLVVFPGHEEYVTRHAFDVIEQFRDRGGNLAFLSANTFVYGVELHGDRMVGRTSWLSRGRPPASLTGSDYVDWWRRIYPNRPYEVVGAHRARWLFTGTGLQNGSTFGRFGIEVDATSAYSPRGTQVLSRITDIFGSGRSAEMTYYETRRGAKVFSAGVLDFGTGAWHAPVAPLMVNLWRHLSAP